MVSYDGAIDINKRIEILLEKKYPEIKLSEEVLEEIKINRCRVRNAGQRYGKDSNNQGYEISYDLPDGTQIKLDQSDLTLPYEKVFKNYVRGEESQKFDLFFQ